MNDGMMSPEKPIEVYGMVPTAKISDANVTLPKLESRARPTNNLLINGGFQFFQRQIPGTATARTDTQFGPDRWRVLTQTASVTAARVEGITASRYAVQLKQTQASAQRMGISQTVEAINAVVFRGRTVRFQAKIRCSASQAIRVAILEGLSEDSVASDVVNDWTSSDYTDGAGKFFNNTNLDVKATASATPSAATWTDISVSATLSSTLTNLVVVVWTEGTAAQNVTLDITEAGLYDGADARDWLPRATGDELRLCQRYFTKTYSVDTEPDNTTAAGALRAIAVTTSATAGRGFCLPWSFKTTMRAVPTITLYRPDSAGSSAWANISTPASPLASTALDIGDNGATLGSNAAPIIGDMYYIHGTAEAEL